KSMPFQPGDRLKAVAKCFQIEGEGRWNDRPVAGAADHFGLSQKQPDDPAVVFTGGEIPGAGRASDRIEVLGRLPDECLQPVGHLWFAGSWGFSGLDLFNEVADRMLRLDHWDTLDLRYQDAAPHGGYSPKSRGSSRAVWHRPTRLSEPLSHGCESGTVRLRGVSGKA